MMGKWNSTSIKLLGISFLVAFFVMLFSEPANANSPLSSITGGGANSLGTIDQVCRKSFQFQQGKELKVISGAVECFEYVMEGVAESSIQGVNSYLSSAVGAALVIYLVIFGAKVITGVTTEQKLKSEFFIGGLKVAFISWLVFSFGVLDMWNLVLGIYDGLIRIVLIPQSAGICPMQSGGTQAVWETVDCIIANFIGWNVTNGTGGKWEGVPLLFGYLPHFFTHGLGGIMFGGLLIMTVLALFMALAKVAFIYLLAMMTLILLFTISPLIFPMMLFQATKGFWEGWWKTVVSIVLQPVLMFAFVSLILALFGELVFGGGGILDTYKQVEPNYQSMGAYKQGVHTSIFEAFNLIKDQAKNQGFQMEKSVFLTMLSSLIIAYLLLSFANFVEDVGFELAGQAIAPKLGSYAPSFLRGFGR